jgi:hypothetical protein
MFAKSLLLFAMVMVACGSQERVCAIVDNEILKDPFPSKYAGKTNTVLGYLPAGDCVAVKRHLYAKDHLLLEIDFDGRRAYIVAHGERNRRTLR